MQQSDRSSSQIEELEAFVAVAQLGSFAKAAQALERDASVISKRVKQLEQRLATPLFSRTTRRVVLTEVGEIYFSRVRTILDELRDANRQVGDLAATPQGLLRISLPQTFGRRWISPLLPKFLSRYPDIRIDARFTDRFVDVVAEGFDATVRLGLMLDSTLKTRKVGTYRNVLAASPTYLERRGYPSDPDELQEHSCLGFLSHASWPDWPLTRGGVRKSIRPKGALVADNSEALLEAALQGAGIILAPDWLVGPEIRAGKLAEILAGWAGPSDYGVFIVLPPGRMVPAKTRAFIEEIARAIKSNWRGETPLPSQRHSTDDAPQGDEQSSSGAREA
ncbi:transcriptional regulator, LysR family (plasmid) [Sinorhizobium americanum]|uniref:Transcriptional regulator, LysR family n=2 Tax=Sinorhizobium americanum TaxID=194963 RepID=A0A1L3LX12_9HYPH|nr:transcriptional regulator, LysR family [Sinorhizobium americanum]